MELKTPTHKPAEKSNPLLDKSPNRDGSHCTFRTKSKEKKLQQTY